MTTASRLAKLNQHKIKAYRWLYEFTASACTDCAGTDCACKDSICAHVEREARGRGHTFAHTGHRLRFIGCKGCVVPPHLRETCTIYLCDKAKRNPGFRHYRYERLKQLCSAIELAIMELQDALA